MVLLLLANRTKTTEEPTIGRGFVLFSELVVFWNWTEIGWHPLERLF